ncbi:MAG: hypothetical protein ACYC96_00830 [Fimbriimonadaceae bacterium]
MSDTAGGTLCPSCGELVPAATPRCGRCGFDVTPARPAPSSATGKLLGPATGSGVFIRHPDEDKPTWQETAFKIMAIAILIEGIVELIGGAIALAVTKGDDGGSLVGHGCLITLIGVGLLAEWPWASLAIKIACWVNLFIAACLIITGGAMVRLSPMIGLVVIAVSAAFAGLYGFMLYLVSTVGLD